jgi:hypothetical protein
MSRTKNCSSSNNNKLKKSKKSNKKINDNNCKNINDNNENSNNNGKIQLGGAGTTPPATPIKFNELINEGSFELLKDIDSNLAKEDLKNLINSDTYDIFTNKVSEILKPIINKTNPAPETGTGTGTGTEKRALIIHPTIYIEPTPDTDFKELIKKSNQEENLYIYNENFDDYSKIAFHPGGGNGFLRKYRVDMTNPDNDVDVKKIQALGIPTGSTGVQINNSSINYDLLNNVLTDPSNITDKSTNNLLKISLENIYKYIIKYPNIKKIYYSSDDDVSKGLGLGEFIYVQFTKDNIISINKKFNELLEKLKSDYNVIISILSKATVESKTPPGSDTTEPLIKNETIIDDENTIKVMTYNIYNEAINKYNRNYKINCGNKDKKDTPATNSNCLDNTITFINKIAENEKLDFIGLQEINGNQIKIAIKTRNEVKASGQTKAKPAITGNYLGNNMENIFAPDPNFPKNLSQQEYRDYKYKYNQNIMILYDKNKYKLDDDKINRIEGILDEDKTTFKNKDHYNLRPILILFFENKICVINLWNPDKGTNQINSDEFFDLHKIIEPLIQGENIEKYIEKLKTYKIILLGGFEKEKNKIMLFGRELNGKVTENTCCNTNLEENFNKYNDKSDNILVSDDYITVNTVLKQDTHLQSDHLPVLAKINLKSRVKVNPVANPVSDKTFIELPESVKEFLKLPELNNNIYTLFNNIFNSDMTEETFENYKTYFYKKYKNIDNDTQYNLIFEMITDKSYNFYINQIYNKSYLNYIQNFNIQEQYNLFENKDKVTYLEQKITSFTYLEQHINNITNNIYILFNYNLIKYLTEILLTFIINTQQQEQSEHWTLIVNNIKENPEKIITDYEKKQKELRDIKKEDKKDKADFKNKNNLYLSREFLNIYLLVKEIKLVKNIYENLNENTFNKLINSLIEYINFRSIDLNTNEDIAINIRVFLQILNSIFINESKIEHIEKIKLEISKLNTTNNKNNQILFTKYLLEKVTEATPKVKTPEITSEATPEATTEAKTPEATPEAKTPEATPEATAEAKTQEAKTPEADTGAKAENIENKSKNTIFDKLILYNEFIKYENYKKVIDYFNNIHIDIFLFNNKKIENITGIKFEDQVANNDDINNCNINANCEKKIMENIKQTIINLKEKLNSDLNYTKAYGYKISIDIIYLVYILIYKYREKRDTLEKTINENITEIKTELKSLVEKMTTDEFDEIIRFNDIDTLMYYIYENNAGGSRLIIQKTFNKTHEIPLTITKTKKHYKKHTKSNKRLSITKKYKRTKKLIN